MQIQNSRRVPTLYWFGHDLRLEDNPALDNAALHADLLLCCYCDDSALLESDRFGTPRLGALRAEFIDTSLAELGRELEARGQALLRLAGNPVAVIGDLIERHALERVVRSRHFGYYENRQWRELEQRHGAVEFVEIDAYTLYDREAIDALGELPPSFSRFRRRVEQLEVAPPSGSPKLPPPLPELAPAGDARLKAVEAPPRQVRDPDFDFEGGTRAAHRHLDAYFAGSAPSTYKLTRNQLDGWTSSGKFSPWLAAGCLSVRRLYHRIKDYEARNGANESTYWLFFELLWREYFQWYARAHGRRVFTFGGIDERPPATGRDPKRFARWCYGDTDWPLVNACMHQLNRSGYLSNRARQIVASALVNELELDWRMGAGYFEQCLIDYDVASNWGNWQYIAGVGADTRGGRHFDIDKQTRLFDPRRRFIRKWSDEPEAGAAAGC